MSETTYRVTGMTCGHCVASVTEEITEIDGVTAVAVDLPTGAVTVTSSTPVSEADVRAAVEEAGYQIADARTPGDRRTQTGDRRPAVNAAMKLSACGAALALILTGAWAVGAAVGPLSTAATAPPAPPSAAHSADGRDH